MEQLNNPFVIYGYKHLPIWRNSPPPTFHTQMPFPLFLSHFVCKVKQNRASSQTCGPQTCKPERFYSFSKPITLKNK